MPKKSQSETFEDLYTELETTIEKLEEGNLPLAEALALYERGIELAKRCAEMLDRAELRIQELTPGALAFEGQDEELDVEDEDGDA
jgi:exodeoxyribonuclease VII small subunit